MTNEKIYSERYRPQFHFTAKENWLNDPNGCVYFDEEYHLFFQHNPSGLDWGNMSWGHAVSPDLIHWRQLPNAILPYDGGTIYSGSAVVDSANLSGLGQGRQGPLVAAFTHATNPSAQALAYSIDKGRNWQLYADGKPVVANQGLDVCERDPKIFWFEPSRKWIMLLWVKQDQVRFFSSDNLLQWKHISDFRGAGFYECPDLIKLALDGNTQDMKWVLCDAALNYWVGSFDGTKFIPEDGPIRGEFGINFYAGQTWNNTGKRIVQIGWMRNGKYPRMPFNQQMSFPCELSLKKTAHGLRLFRFPIREIENLRVQSESVVDYVLKSGERIVVGERGNLFDIEVKIKAGKNLCFGLRLYDQEIIYTDGRLNCLGNEAPLVAVNNSIKLRIIVDRTSIELFGNDGQLCVSCCFLPPEMDTSVQFYSNAGTVRIHKLIVHQLSSAWE